MIKRYYFMNVVCHKNDGSGSFSYVNSFFYRKSWLPQHEKAYNNALKEAKDKYPDYKAQVVSFNRV